MGLGTTRLLAALTGGLLVAAFMHPIDPAVAAPKQARQATGFERILAWEGGETMACRSPGPTGSSEVRVYWRGNGYDWGPRGSAGLAYVDRQFAVSGWTYSSAEAGDSGPVVGLTMAQDSYVYLLVGSQYGITREAIVPVWSLNACSGAGRVEAATTSRTERNAAGQCATKKEFRRIKRGMTPDRVARVLGAKGRTVSSAPYSLIRRYRECGRPKSVVVNFQKSRPSRPNQVNTRFW